MELEISKYFCWLRRKFILRFTYLFFLLSVFTTISKSAADGEGSKDYASSPFKNWQSCNIFFAPTVMGWSVFAGRPIKKGEIFEVSPMFLPLIPNPMIVRHTLLDDYVYGYERETEYSEEIFHPNVVFGMGMFCNHHPSPNVSPTQVGIPGQPHVTGFTALRDIRMGEQLFTTYGDEDGGRAWFENRGLEMIVPDESRIDTDKLEMYMAEFCSKVYAGAGLSTMQGKIEPTMGIDYSSFAPFDAGIGNARAKIAIAAGERIDITIGLPLPRQMVQKTVLSPVLINFHDLDTESQSSLIILRNTGRLTIPYKGENTGWLFVDKFSDYDGLSILPVAGNIGLVRRVGDDPSSNCRLLINWQGSNIGSSGILLELFATKDIAAGDVLKLNMAPPKSAAELELLRSELDEQGGHPYDPSYFPNIHDEL